MRRIVVNEFLSLDGVAQAPGGPEEDTDDGFAHGGWHMPFIDDVAGRWITRSYEEVGGFLLGRRTYEIFAAYWPNAPEEEGDIAQKLNTLPKYVVSRTLREPLDWQNSVLLEGEVAEAVAALREGEGKDLHVIGSTVLVRTLVKHDLVDEYRLMIDPLILGGGKRILPEDGRFRRLHLVDSEVSGTGAFLVRYRRA